MNPETLINFLIATAIVTSIPGPNIMLITNNSIQYGLKEGLVTIAGINAGMVLLFSISLAGVSTLMVQHPFLYDFIKLFGLFFLCYLGTNQIYVAMKSDKHSVRTHKTNNNIFLKGFLISFSNPKGFFFAGAFFPQFLNPNLPLPSQVLILCSGCLLVASLVGLIYAIFAHQASTLFKSNRFHKYSNFFSGSILICFGLGLFFLNSF